MAVRKLIVSSSPKVNLTTSFSKAPSLTGRSVEVIILAVRPARYLSSSKANYSLSGFLVFLKVMVWPFATIKLKGDYMLLPHAIGGADYLRSPLLVIAMVSLTTRLFIIGRIFSSFPETAGLSFLRWKALQLMSHNEIQNISP